MNIKEVLLADIAWEDERFRISEELKPARLAQSLQEVGQLTPVFLIAGEGARHTILSGFRRLHSLKQLGALAVLARLFEVSELNVLEAFRMALWDNLSQRDLTALEKSRALWILRNVCGVPQTILVESYLPLFGLSPHKNILRSYLSLHELHPELRQAFNQGKITVASAEYLSTRPAAFQDRIVSVFDKVRWSASLQREVFDLVEELSVIMGQERAEIFDRPELKEVLADELLSPFQKGERIHKILFRLRNPSLSQAEEHFLAQKKKLGLPGSVRVSPEPFFESPRVRFEFDVSSGAGFRKIAQVLNRAAQDSALDGLFQPLSDSSSLGVAVVNEANLASPQRLQEAKEHEEPWQKEGK